jgi:tRNA threonylcarbamoyladenosine biosynthesis protein TsaB
MALEKPLLSLGSLESLAWKVRDLAIRLDAWICPMIDARRMEVFCKIFDAGIQAQGNAEAKVIEPGAFEEILTTRKMIFLGDGAAKCLEILETSANAIVLPQGLSSAADMGQALYLKFREGKFEDMTAFEPFYLKDFRATKPRDRLRDPKPRKMKRSKNNERPLG